MLNQILRYDHLLIIMGRQEEEKFALVLENMELKEKVEELNREVSRLREENGRLAKTDAD